MRNKLFILLIIGFIISGVTGCGIKESKNVEVTGPRVVCNSSNKTGGITVDTKIIYKFNSDNYVNYELLESTLTFKEKDTYDYYVKSTKEAADSMQLADGVDYSYKEDNKNMKLTTTMIYNKEIFDYEKTTEEDRSKYLASTLISGTESSGATCAFIELTRSDLGLK